MNADWVKKRIESTYITVEEQREINQYLSHVKGFQFHFTGCENKIRERAIELYKLLKEETI